MAKGPRRDRSRERIWRKTLPDCQASGRSIRGFCRARRLHNIKHKDGGGAVQANFTYTYDAAEGVTSAIDNGAAVNYSYDDTNQLTADGTASYKYDALADRIERDEDADGNRTEPSNKPISRRNYASHYDFCCGSPDACWERTRRRS